MTRSDSVPARERVVPLIELLVVHWPIIGVLCGVLAACRPGPLARRESGALHQQPQSISGEGVVEKREEGGLTWL